MNSTKLKLYEILINAWNERNAGQFAELFAEDGLCIGFDGSQMRGKAQIREQLSAIFKDHITAKYVTLVRGVTTITNDIHLLHAHVGMIPPGKDKIDPDKNAVQIMIAKVEGKNREIVLLQNTPAQFHGRAQEVKALTDELQNQFDKNQ
jgi:uncharacterized protein (TIGR02246 family)